MWPQCHPPSLGSIWLGFRSRCGLKIFKNETISAILTLYVTPMLPIKFRLNPTYGLREDVVWRISIWLPWQPSWILERKEDFSNSESLCPSSFGSIQLTVWDEMSFEEFQDCRHGGHFGYRNGTILAILNLYVVPMPPIKFRLSLTYGLGGNVVLGISAILDIGMERF